MNEQIDDCIKKGTVTVEQLQRKTNNMFARQQSQFFMSKYEQSKVLASFSLSKLSKISKFGEMSPKNYKNKE